MVIMMFKETERAKHIKSGRVVRIVAVGKMRVSVQWIDSITYCDNGKFITEPTEVFERTFEAYRESFNWQEYEL